MSIKVKKRDYATVDYDERKIYKAIEKAVKSSVLTEGDVPQHLVTIVRDITAKLDNIIKGYQQRGKDEVDVEHIQDLVEQQLMGAGLYEVAKAYILYREEHKQARNQRLRPDASAIQDYMLASRYARFLPELSRRETFAEAVDRVREMHLRTFPAAAEDIRWAFDRVLEKRCLPSMRSMQFGGKAIETNHARMYNCTFGICDRMEFFAEGLYLLLCGTGVGFSVEFEHVDKLPPLAPAIDEGRVVHFTVPDTIEGWADAMQALIDSYVKGYLVEFNYSLIRPRGAKLSTSGGRAPGHVPLRRAIERGRNILDGALGRKLKPIECYDVMMHAADAVIAGGVRRSATNCLFSADDGEMMNAKRGNWFEENPQRGRSNNSVKLIRDETSKAQFLRIFTKQKEWGEPGFYFANDLSHGCNPCCEIGLNPHLEVKDADGNVTIESGWQFCNLTEINGAKLLSEEDFRIAVRAATIIGTLQAGYTTFPYLGETTEKLCRREALLGVSITGMMDSPAITLDPTLQQKMAKYAIEVNREITLKIGTEPAARLTCVKPAGSTSLLLGTASGIHPRHARRYFRRVQANKTDPIYKFFNEVNPHMCEESVWSANKTDDVITFCVEAPEKAILRSEMSAMDLLKYVHSTQQNWVVPGTARPEMNPGLYHNVSNTLTVREGEWDAVADYIWENRADFTGISMLAATGDKIYQQAPHEEVVTAQDETLWNELISKFRSVDYTEMQEADDTTNLQGEIACAGGACELV
ncbi:ATP cone domain-containing protein [Pontiella sp.]|uniref:ATP cone domain-containing protein n=2 Tax=Pontiella sp. TaxID=2837462 RepID=UPI0035662796